MHIIRFKQTNCKNCYKCIRSCPVKAISFSNDQAQIKEDSCILCGKCLKVCPQNAKSVVDELHKVKEFINKNEKVYASIAPSFLAAFNCKDIAAAINAIKKLGFTHVEETAIGALKVSLEYEKLISRGTMKNIISSACPVIVSLIEKYYIEALNYLAPVVSPMIAHAKIMRKMYGEDIKVVFIGPCLAKKEEYIDGENDKLIDAVLTFEEIQRWMNEENIKIEEEKEYDFNKNIPTRSYPLVGGILKTIKNKNNYKFISIDGIERCMEVLESIKKDNLKGFFIEMNSCSGGCINGPYMVNENYSFLKAVGNIIEFTEKTDSSISDYICDVKVDMNKHFYNKKIEYKIPDEEVIKSILRKIGKFKKEDELNCGACGYSSCREKAIAVYNNKSNLHMCLPYMREKAESMSNIIINSSPNAIIALNSDFYIQEANNAAYKIFNIENVNLIGKYVFDMFGCPDFVVVKDTGVDILNKKFYYAKYDITVEQSIIYAKDQDAIIIIMKDITKEEKRQEQLNKVRSETVDIAQKVIEKQMRVAQEIASLLGETTAETKVALTKLKNTIVTEMGEDI